MVNQDGQTVSEIDRPFSLPTEDAFAQFSHVASARCDGSSAYKPFRPQFVFHTGNRGEGGCVSMKIVHE